MSKKWFALLAVSLSLGACKKDDAPEGKQTSEANAANTTSNATTTAEATETSSTATDDKAPAQAKVVEKKPLERKKVDKAKAKKQSSTFRELLGKGRAQVKSGKYKEGVATFEKALEIDPNNARALSELGWAAFKGEDLERAETATRASIRNSRDSNISGASLYNLGRIHEKRGENDQAATAYERSLQVRPGNKIVTKRLADLKGQGAKVSEANKRCFFIEMSSKVPKPEETCHAFWDETEKAAAASAAGSTIECDSVDSTQKVGGVTVVSFTMRDTEMDLFEEYIAILNNDKWYAHRFNTYDALGVGYNGQQGYFDKIEAKELAGGGAMELVVPYRFNFYDGDYEENTVDTYAEKVTQIISLEGKPELMGLFYEQRRSTSGMWLDDEVEGAKQEEDIVHFDQRSTLSFEGGKVTVKAADGKKSANPEGTFELGKAPLHCYAASEIDMF